MTFEDKLQKLLAEHPEVKSVTFDITKTISAKPMGVNLVPNTFVAETTMTPPTNSTRAQQLDPDAVIMAMEAGVAAKQKRLPPVVIE